MQWSRISDQEDERTFVLVLETGDEVIGTIRAFAEEQRLRASHFTAIGALDRVLVGFFDWQQKDYVRIPIDEQVEVLSLIGDIGDKDGRPALHAHVVVGKRDGTAHGGHLMEGWARPTLEISLIELPTHLRRRFDAQTGLSLIRFR